MPKPTLAAIQASIQDPLFSDNYQLNFPNIPVGRPGVPLLMQCRTVTKPGTTINALEVQLFGHTLEFAGNKTFSHDMSVEYVENRKVEILQTLEEWHEMIRSTQGQHGAFKNEYERDGYLTIFDPKGAVVLEYVVVNCWPSIVPETNFDGSASQIISVPVTFKYDFYYNKTTGVGA